MPSPSATRPATSKLGERGDHLADGESRLPHELVRSRRQEVEEWIACGQLIVDGRLDPERLEDVGRSGERRRAEPQECVRSCGQGGRDLARHREDLPPLLEREVGGDQRAASLTRLNDDRRRAETGDDPVAGREAPRCRFHTGLVLRDDQRTLADRLRKGGVRRRVVAVDAAAEHRDRMAARLECATVRFAVDPPRETAHDHDACRCELSPEHARNLSAIGRARAGTDNRHRRLREHCRITVASDVEPSRRVVNRTQKRRQLTPPQNDHGVASSLGARYASASATCSGRTASEPPSAAIVRETPATFARPRPESGSRSTARVNSSSAARFASA